MWMKKLVSDSTGTGILTVWENEIGKVDEDVCYNLKGVMVRKESF